MENAEEFELTNDQICQIVELLKLPEDSKDRIISDLLSRIKGLGIVTVHKKRIANKNATTLLREELEGLRKAFANLKLRISSLDDQLAFRIDDEFSFALSLDKLADSESTTRYQRYSLRKLLSRMENWAEFAANENSKGSYYFRLYSEVEDFLYWNPPAIDLQVKYPKILIWKLVKVLNKSDEVTAKQQFQRWKKELSRDK